MTQWHCSIDGEKHGPIREEDLKLWIARGGVGSSDLVWTEGMAEWQRVAQVPALAEVDADSSSPGSKASAISPVAKRRATCVRAIYSLCAVVSVVSGYAGLLCLFSLFSRLSYLFPEFSELYDDIVEFLLVPYLLPRDVSPLLLVMVFAPLTLLLGIVAKCMSKMSRHLYSGGWLATMGIVLGVMDIAGICIFYLLFFYIPLFPVPS